MAAWAVFSLSREPCVCFVLALMSRHRYTVQYLGKFPNFVLSVQYWESSLICTANRPNYSTVQYGGKFPNSVLSVQYWRKFSTFVLSIDTIRPGGAYCVQTPDRTTVQCGAGKVSYICTVNRYYVGDCWYCL